MSNKGYLAIIGILVLGTAILGYKFYSFKTSTDQQIEDLDVEFQSSEIERERLELDLERMLIGYDTLHTENEELKLAVASQRIEIEELLSKAKNRKWEISSLKAEAATLRRIMQDYVAEIDSLNTLTQNLTAQVGDLTEGIEMRDTKIVGLEEKTATQEEIISTGQTLQSNGMSAQGIRLTNSGNQKEATRANKVDLIKTCFTIIKNPIAPPGSKTLYMRVVDKNAQVLPAEGEPATTELEGETVAYSVSRQIDYRNESMDVCIYYTITQEMKSGDYTIFVYEGGKKIGSTDLSLK